LRWLPFLLGDLFGKETARDVTGRNLAQLGPLLPAIGSGKATARLKDAAGRKGLG
jgi:hypothetical protein